MERLRFSAVSSALPRMFLPFPAYLFPTMLR